MTPQVRAGVCEVYAAGAFASDDTFPLVSGAVSARTPGGPVPGARSPTQRLSGAWRGRRRHTGRHLTTLIHTL